MSVGAMTRITLPRTVAAAELDDVARVLRDGAEVAGSRERLGSRGFNGYMERLVLADPLDAARTINVIERPAEAQAAQEAFVWRLARQVGIDYLFPAAVVRDSGDAMVQMVPGTTAGKAGVGNAADLQRIAERWYARSMPEMGADAAATQARVDRELVVVIDNVLANHDRGLGNLMVDAEQGGFHAIDQGWMSGGGSIRHGAPVRMQDTFVGSVDGVLELSPRTVEVLRANLTSSDLRAQLATLRADLARYSPGADASMAQRLLQRSLAHGLSRERFEREAVARLERIIDTGRVEFTPLSGGSAQTVVGVAGAVARGYPRQLQAAGIGAAGAAVTGGAALLRD